MSGEANKLADAFGAKVSTKSLINPGHTCSLYLTKEIQQTSSFPLLILQTIMIFCGGWLLMPFCWLRTHGQADCMFGSWVQGEMLCRQTRWSRVLCVCHHVSGDRGALLLWPHCVVEGNNKAATSETLPVSAATRPANACPVCPRFQAGNWREGETAQRNLPQRGHVSLKNGKPWEHTSGTYRVKVTYYSRWDESYHSHQIILLFYNN